MRITDVSGYEGLYMVTDKGDIISKKYGKYRLLKGTDDGKGYARVTLYKSRYDRYVVRVHRLVALHYVERSDTDLVVNHIDGNKSNNDYKNLEWVSQAYNVAHACADKWQVMTPSGLGYVFRNLRAFCSDRGLSQGHMVQVAKGRYTGHKGHSCQKLGGKTWER